MADTKWYWEETAPESDPFEDDFGNKCTHREACFACYGTGTDWGETCLRCGGMGWVPVKGSEAEA